MIPRTACLQNASPAPYGRGMRALALLSLLTLSACIGYARGDADGNVEVVTNWGTFTPGASGSDGTPEDDDATAAE